MKKFWLGIAAATALLIGVNTVSIAHAATADTPEVYVGYFRSWRDSNSDPLVNKNAMSDLPPEVGIAVVFPSGDESANFWVTLPSQIALMHQKGTKVIRNFPIRALYAQTFADPGESSAMKPFTNNTAGYTQRAKEILTHYLSPLTLDGLVVNAEESLSGTNLQRAKGVVTQLAKSVGKQSKSQKLFIYDTNLPGTDALFKQTHGVYNYVFSDAYGRSVSSLDQTWQTFKGLITPNQFIPGFSFYGENGADWGDTTLPLNQSRAYRYAKWEPAGETQHKGGIFAYAVDRDGVPIGADAIVHSDFTWSKQLYQAMNTK